jgi:zinc transport system substrate-binding protein
MARIARPLLLAGPWLVAGPVLLAGCGTGASSGPAGGGGLQVVASFYPLQYVTARILGDAGSVRGLTKPGAEPHDLELSPQDVVQVSKAPLVVYLKGFQPSVDRAVADQAGGRGFDVSAAARLTLSYTPIEGGQTQQRAAGSVDPHFWLDPTRVSDVVAALADRLARVDPGHAAVFAANAAALRSDLAVLDADLRAGLRACANPDLVTSHNAFGYLAQRYGLRQVGIAGLSPDQEPSPARLAEVTTFVRANHVRTIYYETLVSPKIADAVAHAAGVRTDVLDPIEGVTDQSRGTDYLQVMRSDLAALRAGQPCT